MVFWMIFFIGFMWEERERESEGGQMVLRCFQLGLGVFEAYLFSRKFGSADKEVWAHSLLLSFGFFSPDEGGKQDLSAGIHDY